jgi:hypothetical protein
MRPHGGNGTDRLLSLTGFRESYPPTQPERTFQKKRVSVISAFDFRKPIENVHSLFLACAQA